MYQFFLFHKAYVNPNVYVVHFNDKDSSPQNLYTMTLHHRHREPSEKKK